MYYTFKTTIDLNKELNINDNFSITSPFLEFIVDTNNELTDIQIKYIKDNIENIIKEKFNINNFLIELINIIK